MTENKPVMRICGALALMIAVFMLVFSGFTYWELRSLATAATPPSPDAVILGKIVGPELFDPDYASTKPAELAAMVFKRIYLIAGCSFGLGTLGILGLMVAKKVKSP